MKLHVDSTRYTCKPKEDIGTLKRRLQSERNITELSLADIAEKIGQGYSVSPGVMVGGVEAKHWTGQQLFLIDIDNDKPGAILSPAGALEICAANDLQPVFWYESFRSSTAKPKFRLAFVAAEPVTDTQQRALIIETLISLFAQSDTSCKNADRFFFGTNGPVQILDLSARINIESVCSAHVPPPARPPGKSGSTDLDRLKRDFDFFGFLQNRNGEIFFNNSKCAMFLNCELCGHKKDLVYYHATNTFMCFGAAVHRGGSIIDYLMISERMTAKEAIDLFYSMNGAQRNKRDYAIVKNVPLKLDLVERVRKAQESKGYSLNDKGAGALFADVFKDEARFNVTANSWYFYNGRVWAMDQGAMRVSQLAKDLADALLIYSTTISDEARKKVYTDFVSRFGQFRYRETMIKDSRDCFFMSQEDLDSNLDLLNCQNGTLNLKSFEFREHRPCDLLSKISNVVFDPSAKSEPFEKFVDDVMMGNAEKKDYLQRVLGYSLSADTSLETCFMLYGATTRNGKSTLVETISYLLGGSAGYSMTMQPQTLAAKQNKDSRQASGDIARLKGCRFLNASEPPKRMIFDVALLKTLLGRDTITARHLHEREFEFVPCFKMFINTNFLPLIQDDSLFSSGRINVISFDRHFEPAEQNRKLKDQLRTEQNLSGIFNWCLDGLKKFRQSGAEPPAAILAATSEYRSNSDKLGNFIGECLEKSEQNSKAVDVYARYRRWCELNGFGLENKGNFYDELRGKNLLLKLGSVDGRTVKNVVLGHRIIEDTDPFLADSCFGSRRRYG